MSGVTTTPPRPDESDLDIEKDGKDEAMLRREITSSPNSSSETLEMGEIEQYPTKHEPITKTASNIARKVLTKISTKHSYIDPGPPPDGGFKAWLQCGCGCLVVATTWGFINSFGMFQQYYVTFLDRPASDIAWIGSLQVFFLFFLGTFSGRLADAGYFKQVVFVGSVMQLLGLCMASISTKYWHFILAQGICVGIGNGCLFCPGVALVATYFSTKKSLAIGISASGSALGGLIFPAMVQNLIPQIGFPWTMRAIALVDGLFLLFVNVFAKQRVPPRRNGQILDLASFRDKTYLFFGIAMFFTFWGLYVAFFLLAAFARENVGFAGEESINLVLVLNGVGLPGRVIPNYLADRKTGPLNLIIFAACLSAVCMYCLTEVTSKAGIYVWAVAYGLVGAAVQSLFPATLGSLSSSDLSKSGVRIGMIFTIVSFAVLSGPPIAGALVEKGEGSYNYAWIFAGSSIMVGTCFHALARFHTTGFVLFHKV